MNKKLNRFYVYVYLDPRKPGRFVYGDYEFDYEPFYVGKGFNDRIVTHLFKCRLENDGNKLKTNKIKKIIRETGKEPIGIIYKEKLSEQDAFDLETKMIKTIGRKDLVDGVLTNLTNGGDGSFGYKHTYESKQKISQAGVGRTQSEETKMKISKGNNGRKRSKKIKKKLSESKSHEKHPSNKYQFICSYNKDYWKDFTKAERNAICQKFFRKKVNNIVYHNILITRILK
jgi:hypothetical protein